jgi:hypothetical protein
MTADGTYSERAKKTERWSRPDPQRCLRLAQRAQTDNAVIRPVWDFPTDVPSRARSRARVDSTSIVWQFG